MVPSVQIGQHYTVFTSLITNSRVLPNGNRVKYKVSKHAISRSKRGSLVDRGANGGIIGNDAKVILQHQREVDVTGIDNHELSALKMVDASALLHTQLGPVIGIFKQYAYHGIGRTIHSAGQMEWYKNIVDDKSMKVGGKQYIKTNDGYAIPIDIINGLPYIKMQPNTDKEFEELPHVILTSGAEWDPTVLDNIISDQEDWYTNIKELNEGLIVTPFDERGNYKKRQPQPEIVILPDPSVPEELEANLHQIFEAASDLNRIYVLLSDIEDGVKIEADKYIELEPKRIDNRLQQIPAVLPSCTSRED